MGEGGWTTAATIVATGDIAGLGPRADGGFVATGFEPRLLIDLGRPQPAGWYEIVVVVEAERQLQLRIHPGAEDLAASGRSSVLRQGTGGRFTGTFRMPEPFRQLRLDPARSPGPLRIAELSLRRMRARDVAAMGLAGARRAAARGPGPLLRFVRDALATLLRPARFETFQPPAALTPSAADPDACYRTWIERHEPALAAARTPPPDDADVAVLLPLAGDDAATIAGAAATLAALAAQTVAPRAIVVAGPEAALAALAAVTPPAPATRLLHPVEPGVPPDAAALAAATGRHVLRLAPGDRPRPRMIEALAAAAAAAPAAVAVHGDEDRLDAEGRRSAPWFKPAWSPALLESWNYFGRPVLYDRAAVVAAGGIRPGFDGAEDHDLALRVTDGAGPEAVVRVAEVLLSRPVEAPPAAAADAAAGRALADRLDRRGRRGTVEAVAGLPGHFHVRRALPEPAPAVTIVVPTRDRRDLVEPCIASILALTRYPDFEILVVDNRSTDPATLAFLAEIARHPRVRVLPHPFPFDFAAINNHAAAVARGDVLCLMNNDVEVLDPDWLAEMVALAVEPDVGPVGARLVAPDGTIQHAGVLVGMHGIAGHVDAGEAGEAAGAFGRLKSVCEVAAVTAACMVVRRSVYEALGGLDSAVFPIDFNDFDFCFKARRAGLRVLYTGFAALLHRESASRGRRPDPTERARATAAAAAFRARWGRELLDDPYVSPHWDRAAGRWTARP